MMGWLGRLQSARAGGWWGDYVRGRMQAAPLPDGTLHILFMFADHWEPSAGGASGVEADARLRDWTRLYPRATAGHADSDGRQPRHSFFYPYDQYRRHELAELAALCADGFGEVELHLHHRDDTSASLARKLQDAAGLFREAGCLGNTADGGVAFGFVHGDWALDNSRQEGGRNFCGVNDELQVLARAGCFADFTFPAFGCSAQPRWVNRIMRVTDDPNRPRSYDRGRDAQVGATGGDLVLLSGPLTAHVSGGRLRLDDAQVTGVNVPRPDRADAWINARVHVRGRPEWIFVKIHTHGCTERNRLPLLSRELDLMWTDLERRYNDGDRYRLHYVTAREAFNIVRAAEDGRAGDPGLYRDYEIAAPSQRTGSAAPIRCPVGAS